jgi:hypothetical protein
MFGPAVEERSRADRSSPQASAIGSLWMNPLDAL